MKNLEILDNSKENLQKENQILKSPQKPLLALMASAGSGKTFRLCLRYLELLFLGANPSQILATTFTKKAAIEMKERINQILENLKNHDNSDKTKAIINELNNIGISEEFIYENIERIYKDFLNSNLHISTMDSFFHNILRKFCWFANVENGFKIISENKEKINNIFLEKLGENGRKNLIELCIESDIKLQDISEFCFYLQDKTLLNFTYLFEEYLKYDKKEIQAEIQKLESEILKEAFLIKECVENFEEASKSAISAVDFNDFSTLLEKGKTWLTKTSLNDYRDFKKIDFKQDNLQQIQKKINEIINLKDNLYFQNLYKVLELYYESIESFFKENSALSFSWASKKTYELLCAQNGNNPKISREFLYFRLDSDISHILLDEFQDTNITQYEILKPLFAEFGSGFGAKNFARTLFVVGDQKQSIYSFRGGNQAIFNLVLKIPNMKKESMKYNYRSAKKIIDFVNITFEPIFKEYNKEYFPQIAALKNDGEVFLCEIEKIKKDDELIGENTNNDDILLQDLQNKISLLKARKTGNFPKNDNDIAVLTFKNNDAERAAEFLRNYGHKVVLESDKKINNSKDICVILGLLKYIQNIWNIKSENERPNELFLEEFLSLLNIESSKEKKDEIKYFIKRFNKNEIPAKILLKIAQKYHINSDEIRIFLEQAMEYKNLNEFLDNFENNSKSVNKIADGIRIMTIHKSKGLEFPFVFVLDSGRKNNNKKFIDELDNDEVHFLGLLKKHNKNENTIIEMFNSRYKKAKEAEEGREKLNELNAIYVALTRASSELYVLFYDKGSVFAPIFFDKAKKEVFRDDLNCFKVLEKTNGNIIENIKIDSIQDSIKNKDIESKYQKIAIESKMKTDLGRQAQMLIAQEQEEEKIQMNAENKKRQIEGTALHFCLEKILTNNINIDILITLLYNKFALYLKENECEKIAKNAKYILENSQLTEILAGKKARCEISFWDKDFNAENISEKRLKTARSLRRLDLLIECENENLVIDYKSGAKSEKHHEQVRQYAARVAEITGKSTRGFLFYSRKCDLVPVC